MAFVAQAVSQALHAFPTINATWAGDDLIQRRSLNLGIAVDTEEGLIVPVVKDADHMNVAALAVAIADVAQRARRRKLKLDEVQGGTFTIDNTGVFGSVASGPIINYPQVAILTTEAVVKRPVVVDNDAIAIRSMMNLTLSFDHRAMDGSTAAGFTAHVRDSLQAIGPTTAIY
ncbi:MAG: 2-oxo acid dehydrogenase subunit E2, partial [Dehalococcoidia bacterium]